MPLYHLSRRSHRAIEYSTSFLLAASLFVLILKHTGYLNSINITAVSTTSNSISKEDDGKNGNEEITTGKRIANYQTKASLPSMDNEKIIDAKCGRGTPGSASYYKLAKQLNTIVKTNKTAYKSRTCSVITGRRILMNYAHNCCKKSQPLNCQTALQHGFDICMEFSQKSIEPFFLELNKNVFTAARMAGYGVWKPYLIIRVLMTLEEDDVLFYSDSGAKFVASPENYFCLMHERQQDAVVFSVGLPEDQFTKGDAFLIANCTTEECQTSQQRMGGYSMYRKSMQAMTFLSTWLTFNQDLRVVSDQSSYLSKNLPKFRGNRHDQTALSLASKKVGLPEWPDPSQWGENGWNKMLREKPEFASIAKTIIDCTRDKS